MSLKTQIVAIVNVTPDSFSGDGVGSDVDAALRAIERHLSFGAAVIDIGAESTRPYAAPVSSASEWQRLAPVLRAARVSFPNAVLSIDTRHTETAKRAIGEGADWINDVSGSSDRAMIDAVRDSDVKLVVTHSLSVPPDAKHVIDHDADPVTTVIDFARQRLTWLNDQGIVADRLIFDPGIGFGKTARQSMELVERADALVANIAAPLLVGHSRKSFLTAHYDGLNRDEATLRVSAGLIGCGVAYLRVHDVQAHAVLIA